MAPSAVPFKPSYTTLKNLRHKVYNYTATLVNLSLPIQLQDLFTDSTPYLNSAIGMLSDTTAFLYNNNVPWAIKVIEVKKGINKINAKVDKVKTEVVEIKTEVVEIKTEVAEIKTGIKLLKERLKN